ncbi:hypothetical protein Bbelb_190050 [Branchiostoma belcheri]|nr:hypothetical protein Bbelb_190050 [Branchiostoma belcheri]
MGLRSVSLYVKTEGTTGNQAPPPDQYDGRVDLVFDVNLKLTGVTLEDERQYKCDVTTSTKSETSFINLQVLDTRTLAHRQYENVPHSMMASQRPGSGSDENEVPMETDTVQPPTGSYDEYEVPMETIQPPTVQPPQSSDGYQELRPAVYQSLQNTE